MQTFNASRELKTSPTSQEVPVEVHFLFLKKRIVVLSGSWFREDIKSELGAISDFYVVDYAQCPGCTSLCNTFSSEGNNFMRIESKRKKILEVALDSHK